MFTIGVDVGGTQTRVAAIDSEGRVLFSQRAPTPRGGDELLEWITLAVGRIPSEAAWGSVRGVGLALPGIVDTQQGILVRSVNLSFLEGRPVREELANRIGIPVMVMTDADAATWGEYSACAPRPRRFVHLRLGTGVACGVIVDGRTRSTGVGRTTHWKVLVVDERPEAAACPCGLRGCLETVASGPALESRARSMGYADGLAGLQRAWEQANEVARKIIEETANALAAAISNLKSQISEIAPAGREPSAADGPTPDVRGLGPPEIRPLPYGRGSDGVGTNRLASARGSDGGDACGTVVCAGGGVIAALPCLVEQTAIRVRAHDREVRDGVIVRSARLGDDVGVIGAAMLVRDTHTTSPRSSEPRAEASG